MRKNIFWKNPIKLEDYISKRKHPNKLAIWALPPRVAFSRQEMIIGLNIFSKKRVFAISPLRFAPAMAGNVAFC